MESLREALEKLKLASTDNTTDSTENSLDCLLSALTQNNTEASRKMQEMGILSLLPTLLNPQSSCTPKVANIIAEMAKNEFMRSPCVEAGLIPPLVQLLNSTDQEVLLQTGRALGNICYDSHDPDDIVTRLFAIINDQADSHESMITLKIEGLKKTIDFVSEELIDIKKKVMEVDAKAKKGEERLRTVENRMMELERYSRRWNLRLVGVPENDQENIRNKVILICQKTIANDNINEADGIDIVHRLGKSDHSKKTARNIIIQFLSLRRETSSEETSSGEPPPGEPPRSPSPCWTTTCASQRT